MKKNILNIWVLALLALILMISSFSCVRKPATYKGKVIEQTGKCPTCP